MSKSTPRFDAVLRVRRGRGFVVEGRRKRFVITSAHCLPKLPPFYCASDTEELTLRGLLGLLGGRCTVWAECLFADPVSDLAVLGMPDCQELPGEADAYNALVSAVTPMAIADLRLSRARIKNTGILGPPQWQGGAQLMALDGHPINCQLTARDQLLWMENAAEQIVGGMSGSPITIKDQAVGVVSSASVSPTPGTTLFEGCGPSLARALPRWLLDELMPLS